MKRKIFIVSLLGLFIFTSCKNSQTTKENPESIAKATVNTANDESFHVIEDSKIEEINQRISSEKLKTEEEIMNAYYAKDDEAEGNYSYSVSTQKTDDKTIVVTLVVEGIMDDSLLGQKVLMTIINDNTDLKVLSIKENYKCRKDRGHENWSAEKCL